MTQMNPSYFVSVVTNPYDSEPKAESVRYDIFVRRLLRADTEPMEALHIALGIAGEIGEFLGADPDNRTNNIEELGDFNFYFQAALNHYNLVVAEFGDVTVPLKIDMEFYFPVYAANFLDEVKKEYIYRKPRDLSKVRFALAQLYSCYLHIIKLGNVNHRDVLQENGNKLAKRYVGLVYSDKSAQDRADKVGEQN